MDRQRFPAILALALGAFALFGSAAGAATEAVPGDDSAPAPKAVVEEPILDLGRIPRGDTVEGTFKIKNEGDAPLELREVRSSCACTVTRFDRTIAPGETGTVTTVLDTANLQGANVKAVTVFTNDPKTPSLRLSLRSEVKPYLAAYPGYARFITVQKEAQGNIPQTLWATDGEDFDIVRIESPYPYLKTSFHEATEEERRDNVQGRQWIVDIVLDPDSPVGALTDYVKIFTNHPTQTLVSLPVSGFVRPILAVTPPEVNLREMKISEPRRVSLDVRNFSADSIQMTGVSSDLEAVSAKIVPLEEGRRYQVQVEIGTEMPKGPFNGTLKLTTDSAKMPQVVVPLKGRVL